MFSQPCVGQLDLRPGWGERVDLTVDPLSRQQERRHAVWGRVSHEVHSEQVVDLHSHLGCRRAQVPPVESDTEPVDEVERAVEDAQQDIVDLEERNQLTTRPRLAEAMNDVEMGILSCFEVT